MLTLMDPTVRYQQTQDRLPDCPGFWVFVAVLLGSPSLRDRGGRSPVGEGAHFSLASALSFDKQLSECVPG